MSKQLVLSVPGVPEDAEFHIAGLGVFVNGSHEISDEQAKVWEQTSGMKWPKAGDLSLPRVEGDDELVPLVEFETESDESLPVVPEQSQAAPKAAKAEVPTKEAEVKG